MAGTISTQAKPRQPFAWFSIQALMAAWIFEGKALTVTALVTLFTRLTTATIPAPLFAFSMSL